MIPTTVTPDFKVMLEAAVAAARAALPPETKPHLDEAERLVMAGFWRFSSDGERIMVGEDVRTTYTVLRRGCVCKAALTAPMVDGVRLCEHVLVRKLVLRAYRMIDEAPRPPNGSAGTPPDPEPAPSVPPGTPPAAGDLFAGAREMLCLTCGVTFTAPDNRCPTCKLVSRAYGRSAERKAVEDAFVPQAKLPRRVGKRTTTIYDADTRAADRVMWAEHSLNDHINYDYLRKQEAPR